MFLAHRAGKTTTVTAALAAILMTLAACSSTATDNTADEAADTSTSAAAATESAVEATDAAEADDAPAETGQADATASFPITVTTRYGDVTIPQAPERVVALNATVADELLSLGIEPIAVAADPATLAAYYPWMTGTIEDVADAALVSPAQEINLEAIAQSKPDLIVGDTYQFADQAAFDQISAIAPTVIPNSDALNVDWDVRLLSVAEALGKSAAAQSIIDGIRADFAEIGDAVPGIDTKTYQWVRVDPDGYGFGNGSVLDLFGMIPAPNQDNTQNGPVLSKENTSQLDADLLGVWAPTDDLRAALDNDPLYQALPAVKSGHVFYADMPLALAANTPAPMALAWLKDTLADTVTALG